MIRISVSHDPEFVDGRRYRDSWADTVDEARFLLQAAAADIGHEGGIESIRFELHGGFPPEMRRG